MAEHSIAHDVAVESEMAHESLSTLTAVVQEGIDRTLAARGGLSPETIAELRRLCEAATPGPWEMSALGLTWTVRVPGYSIGVLFGLAHEQKRNGEFIAAAREWLPKLLDMVAGPLSAGEPDGMETTTKSSERHRVIDGLDIFVKCYGHTVSEYWKEQFVSAGALLRDFDRLLAREAKAREEEREACAKIAEGMPAAVNQPFPHAGVQGVEHPHLIIQRDFAIAAAIRARSKS